MMLRLACLLSDFVTSASTASHGDVTQRPEQHDAHQQDSFIHSYHM